MTYTIAQLFVNYILRSPQRGATLNAHPDARKCTAVVQLLSIVRHDYRSSAMIINRPSLLSIARHYYRSPAMIIDRPSLLSIARHDYRSPTTEFDRDATPIEHTTY